MNSIIIPGLWFNADGDIGKQIREHIPILDCRGIPTIKERVAILLDELQANPTINTLIGHNTGCRIIEQAFKETTVGQIKQIIMLNPAPMAGIRFGLKNSIFWSMLRLAYLPTLLLGKDLMLSGKDIKKHFVTKDFNIEHVMENIAPESGAFIRELMLQQYHPKQKLILPRNVRLGIVSSEIDRVIGKTTKKTTELLTQGSRTIQISRKRDHFWSLRRFAVVMADLNFQGFRI